MGIAYNTSIVTSGLVFALDTGNTRSYAGSGLTVNSLVEGINGTLVNGTGFSSANSGSLFFDGTNDYTDFSTYTPNANTVNIWVRFNSLQNGPIVYVGNDTYASGSWSWSFFNYGGAFYFRANSGNLADFYETPPLATWINYTLIRDNGSGQSLAYKNGTFFGTSSNSTLTNSFPNLRFAKAGSTYASFNLSLVQIYNRALSATEISQNFNATRDRYGI